MKTVLAVELGGPVSYDAVEQEIRAYEPDVVKFYHDGDLRNCHNEQFPTGIALSVLIEKYAGTRLIVLSTGHRMINPVTGKLLDWAIELKGVFHSCTIFTPIPKKEWGLYELKLKEMFSLREVPGT